MSGRQSMRWEQGRATLDAMLTGARPYLQRVQPSREQADVLLVQASAHLQSAGILADSDPEGAYAILYDAARKSLMAVLENQGLRPTSVGGHLAVYDAVRAQLDPPLGHVLRSFDRMRRARNNAEYASADDLHLTGESIRADLPKARAILDLAAKVLDDMSPY